jgi:2-oxoglutarate/2-oxoacid ferredoxin oxidoreductase subunit alpha
MQERILITGNEAAGEAAIVAGCRHYFGYPITPQNELTEYMAMRMPQVGGTFIQAESELAAISMVHGVSAAGARAMTSSSSPGISLKQEGLSYMAGAELPGLVVNVQRAGPGLGDIGPSQSDYFQSVKGGGHGDYHLVVLAPHTVQEVADLVQDGFDLADLFRMPTMILMDGLLGQMMEPACFDPRPKRDLPPKDWALTGAADGRPRRFTRSYYPAIGGLERHNDKLQARYAQLRAHEVRYEAVGLEDASLVLVAYGTPARFCKDVVKSWDGGAGRVGLVRPITLFPFPSEVLAQAAADGKQFLVVEMSAGQMVEDVRLAVNGRSPVHFHGRTGGCVPTAPEIAAKVREILQEGN